MAWLWLKDHVLWQKISIDAIWVHNGSQTVVMQAQVLGNIFATEYTETKFWVNMYGIDLHDNMNVNYLITFLHIETTSSKKSIIIASSWSIHACHFRSLENDGLWTTNWLSDNDWLFREQELS